MELTAGERVNRWRRHQNKTLKDLAADADMKVATLHRIIHGQQPARDYELVALARALEMSVGDLLEGELPPEAPAQAS